MISELDKAVKMHQSQAKRLRKAGLAESMNPSAVKKMRDEFEKTGELPPHLKKFAKDLNAMKKKHKVKNIVVPGLEWMSDMKESVNETKFYAFYNNKRHQINGKDAYDAKLQAIKKLKVPKSKVGVLAIMSVKAYDNQQFRFESINEGKGVEKVLKMANDQSFGKLGGRTVDALSAGLFKGVYDKASDKNKEKINKMNEKQLYVFMTKLWSKFGNQVRIG